MYFTWSHFDYWFHSCVFDAWSWRSQICVLWPLGHFLTLQNDNSTVNYCSAYVAHFSALASCLLVFLFWSNLDNILMRKKFFFFWICLYLVVSTIFSDVCLTLTHPILLYFKCWQVDWNSLQIFYSVSLIIYTYYLRWQRLGLLQWFRTSVNITFQPGWLCIYF